MKSGGKTCYAAAEEKCDEILQFNEGYSPGAIGYPYGKIDFDLYLTSYTKINARCISVLNEKSKSIKL